MSRDKPETYTKAEFWKCALQVNPFSYIKYRGTDHGLTEAEYNRKLLDIALENDIKVIGMADHGCVEDIDALREIMNQNGILVFPGFEISSSEKAHFVCLFSENTSKNQLETYLGALGCVDQKNKTDPSSLTGNDLIAKVEEMGGFTYAAHCVDDSGILHQKLVHVWKNPLLKAAQIPGSLDELKNAEGNAYRLILQNKDSAYKRDLPIGIINAKDVATPEDLANPKASCLIKMTRPCFDSFKQAFCDTESRVRLNSDISQRYFSYLETLKITGGYLDTLVIDFSKHLNAIIGGRGTGKSTLIECLRFVLDLPVIGKDAQRIHDQIIRENIGQHGARVQLTIRSSTMHGKKFIIARRYGESPIVTDGNGTPSSFKPIDLIPNIEIYGQNEIFEIAHDRASQRALLSRFMEAGQKNFDARINEVLSMLSENRKKLTQAWEKVALVEDDVAKLSKLIEQSKQFKDIGLEEKLKIVPLLETEKNLLKRVTEEETANLDNAFKAVRDSLPDTVFLSDAALANLPHADLLRTIRNILDKLKQDTEELLNVWGQKYATAKTNIEGFSHALNEKIGQNEEELEKTFREIPAYEGKSGKQIGLEYQKIIKEIERIRPLKTELETRQALVVELGKIRKKILAELSELRAERSSGYEKSLKSLNKKLEGKLKLSVKPESDRAPVIEFLVRCNLSSVKEGRLNWIFSADKFSPVRLAELIRSGAEALCAEKWGITSTVASSLTSLASEQLLELEEIELPDQVTIELNTSHSGAENFKPLDKLSTGQQCTAILHLLLLQNQDPLIMDQPEDNLDNAFIADRIVSELRRGKLSRQYIFATHNANIPVFGDAEWIGVLRASDEQAFMPAESQGAIDVPAVRDMAAEILEGGKAAFIQRKEKYGYK